MNVTRKLNLGRIISSLFEFIINLCWKTTFFQKDPNKISFFEDLHRMIVVSLFFANLIANFNPFFFNEFLS